MSELLDLFDKIVDPHLLIRRITLSAHHLITNEQHVAAAKQISLFSSSDTEKYVTLQQRTISAEKEKSLQEALLFIKKTHGKNAILRGANFISGATAQQRNRQIGGHKA